MTRLIVALAAAMAVASAAEIEKIRNDRVIVVENTLAPGESWNGRTEYPFALVYTDNGSVKFAQPGLFIVRNTTGTPLRVVRVEFLGKGSDETWGKTGIPHYEVILENRYARIYNIKVPAGTTEPQHTHRDRVVVCLSGATLVHTMPDGRSEPATLTAGQIDWRLGATHVGHNTGKTDLWVVAIEPK